MARNIWGNTTTATETPSSPATLSLMQTLGNTQAAVYDPTTKRVDSFGGYTLRGFTDNLYIKTKNTVGEQRNSASKYSVLQDEVAAYNCVISDTTSGGFRIFIFDDDLTLLDNIPVGVSGYQVEAIRLYNGKIYRFCANTTNIRVVEYDIATKATINYDYAHGQGGQPSLSVFNWPVGGKYHIFWWEPGSPYTAGIVTFDHTTKALAGFATWTGGSSSSYVSTVYGLHVRDDGGAASVAIYNGSSGQYGVLSFTAGSGVWTPKSASGHSYWSRTGGYYTFGDGSSGSGNEVLVTAACLFDRSPPVASGYYSGCEHLQGGDTEVRLQEFAGGSDSPYSSNNCCSARHGGNIVISGVGGVVGQYELGRNGTSLTVTYKGPRVGTGGNDISCLLADTYATLSTAGSAGSAYLSSVAVRTEAGRTGSWSFAVSVTGQNNILYANDDRAVKAMAFVTRKGKLFVLGAETNPQQNIYAVLATIPHLVAAAVTYNVTVIGGGGSSVPTSPVHGQSSSIGGVAAAAGANRTGGKAGSQIITSGPLRGTGGAGYYDEGYGAGEDATAAGQYGGGGGYMAKGTLTAVAGEIIPYQVGLPPQYGGQGAIILEEVA